MMQKIIDEIQNDEQVEIKVNYIVHDRDNYADSYGSCKLLSSWLNFPLLSSSMKRLQGSRNNSNSSPIYAYTHIPVCKALSDGVSFVMDTTWDAAWPSAMDALRTSNLPYLHIELSIKPYVRAFIRYLEANNIFDAAFIFQNTKGKFCFKSYKSEHIH